MLAERVDQGHVQRRKTADVAHVNSEIEAVGVRRFDQSTQGGSVRGAVDQLKQLLVLEAIDDTEKPLRRPTQSPTLNSPRPLNDSLHGSTRSALRTTSRVMPERVCGRSTAHTSWSGTSARNP